MKSRTKVVATVGPASANILSELIVAGVDVFRLNLSHGPLDAHVALLHEIRRQAAELDAVVAVLADLPGPKVRAGQLPSGGVLLTEGETLVLVPGDEDSTQEVFSVDYPSLLNDLVAGDRVVIGDGAISLTVTEVSALAAVTRIVTGGRTQGRPGVHIPAERLRLTTPTVQDLRLASIMAAEGADFLAVSFVRAAADLDQVRAHVLPHAPQLVAKIETLQAVAAIEEIASAADVIMVARGDLGIECPLEDVPHLQKAIIRTCVDRGVPVITATQVLESMITAPTPTRAEASDIANAVFDGTDALMLSAETAIGSDPVNVVTTMRRIALRAEAEAHYNSWGKRLGRQTRRQWPDGINRSTMAITHAAGLAAHDAGASAIMCCTTSGRTARLMSRFRPTINLVALSPDPAVVRQLALSWGVIPIQVATHLSSDDMVWHAVEQAAQREIVAAGQCVLVLAGSGGQSGAPTNVMRVVDVY